jgi:hypothetical protein
MTLAPPRPPVELEQPEPPRGGAVGWLRENPCRRVPPALAAGTLAAGEVAGLVGASWYYPAAGTGLAAVIGMGVAARNARRRWRVALPGQAPGPGFGAREVAAWTVAAGAWITACAVWGGPDWRLLLTLAILALAARARLRRHPATRARQAAELAAALAAQAAAAKLAEQEARRAAEEARRAWWRGWAPGVGLAGTFALDWTETRLGDHWVIDIASAGLLASTIQTGVVEELWAQKERLPVNRVSAYTLKSEPAGRLHIHVRRRDPWEHPFPHPAADPASPWAGYVPDAATCTVPLVIGLNPENEEPLPLSAWDQYGGKLILILASPGSGKTVLMNCVTERLTACLDAVVIQLNLIKPREDIMWAPACHLSVLGGDGDEVARARRALAWVVGELTARATTLTAESKVRPSRENPLIVVKADELPTLRADWVCAALLDTIGGLLRSEAVSLVAAAQTRRSQHVGQLLRGLVHTAITGRFTTSAEARRAADGLPIPDMGAYGDGARGVMAVCELGGGGVHLGRTFMLEHPPEIAAIAARRAARVTPPRQRTPALAALWDEAAGDAPLTARWADESIGGVKGEAAVAVAAVPGYAGQAVPGPVPGAVPVPGGPPAPGRDAGAVRDRIAAAMESVGVPDHLVPLDPAAQALYLAGQEERRAAYLEATFGAVEVPPDMVVPLLALATRPGGVSSREAARILLGDEKHRWTTLGWLKKFETPAPAGLGWVAHFGAGPKQGYQATDAGRDALAGMAGDAP